MGLLQAAFPGGTELMLIIIGGLIWLLLPFGLAYWVYNDATSHENENAPWWAIAAGGLTFLTFFGGFLVIAVYIWDRN